MNSGIAPAAEKETTGPRSLMRLLGLFDILAMMSDGMTLAELSVELETPKSSLLNLLRPLVAEGFLIHDGTRYKLGRAIFRMSANIMATWNFSKMLRPYLVELAERSGESVYLNVLDAEDNAVVTMDGVESKQAIRAGAGIGWRGALYATSSGRVLLAHAPQDYLENYLRTAKLERFTPATIISKKSLQEELARVRESGFSAGIREVSPEFSGSAVPVFGPDGSVVAALGLGGPAERFERNLPKLKELLLDVGRRASGR